MRETAIDGLQGAKLVPCGHWDNNAMRGFANFRIPLLPVSFKLCTFQGEASIAEFNSLYISIFNLNRKRLRGNLPIGYF
jgi:hypothetical protein